MLTRDTKSARIEMHASGCAIVRVREEITQTLDDARANVTSSLELCEGISTNPILVDITRTAPLTSEVRHYYVGGALANNFSALGILVEPSPLGRMMGSVFVRMIEAANQDGRATAIPTRLFEDEETAIAWLASVGR